MKSVRFFLGTAIACAAALCVALLNAHDLSGVSGPMAPPVMKTAQNAPAADAKPAQAKTGCDEQDDDDDAAEVKKRQSKVDDDDDDIEHECEDENGPDDEREEHEGAGRRAPERAGKGGARVPALPAQAPGKVEPRL